MGCDIHLNVEVNVPVERRDGKKYWHEVKDTQTLVGAYGWDGDVVKDLGWGSQGRNYEVFGALADVRNYYGGPVLSHAKGLPDDVSESIMLESERWGGDAHSHSYLTLKELKAFDRERNIKIKGAVDIKVAEKFRETGELPQSWSDPKFHLAANRGEVIEWEQPLGELVNVFFDSIIRRLEDLKWPWLREAAIRAAELDDDIRIVFWFDN